MTDQGKVKRIWKPVREQAADSFWLLIIASMSITVLLTRMFLEMTGYPQVGDSTYHIAHVLWGGLLLFIAVTLPMSLVNRYALWISAVLGGIGAGLFIDEVGKFITTRNDYFFPLAFPIVYSFILVCVWLFYRIRRYQPRDPRTLLYHALEDMKQVLDNDLDPFEYRELLTELQQVVAKATDPNELNLAQALLGYIQSRDVRLALRPNPVERLIDRTRHQLAGWPPRLILKSVLIVGFGVIALEAAVKLIALISEVRKAGPLRDALSNFVVINGKSAYTIHDPTMLLISTLAVIGIGVLAVIAAILLLIGREPAGLRIGVLGLVIALSIVNPFTFFFSQLAALVEASIQLFLLCVAGLYRWRFLSHNSRKMASSETQRSAAQA